jgi:hypothetical protein
MYALVGLILCLNSSLLPVVLCAQFPTTCRILSLALLLIQTCYDATITGNRLESSFIVFKIHSSTFS